MHEICKELSEEWKNENTFPTWKTSSQYEDKISVILQGEQSKNKQIPKIRFIKDEMLLGKGQCQPYDLCELWSPGRFSFQIVISYHRLHWWKNYTKKRGKESLISQITYRRSFVGYFYGSVILSLSVSIHRKPSDRYNSARAPCKQRLCSMYWRVDSYHQCYLLLLRR